MTDLELLKDGNAKAARMAKRNKLNAKASELLAHAITEAVVSKCWGWNGRSDPVSKGLKADVYFLVLKILREGVEV